MTQALNNQVALVTGASRGIGRAIALELARQGATVVGTATSEAGAQAITAYFAEAGVKGAGVVLNVNDAARCEAVIDETIKTYGGLNILVNNAGPDPVTNGRHYRLNIVLKSPRAGGYLSGHHTFCPKCDADLLAQQPHGKCGCTGAGTPGSSTHLHHEGASV